MLQDVPGVAFVDVDELGFVDAGRSRGARLEPGRSSRGCSCSRHARTRASRAACIRPSSPGSPRRPRTRRSQPREAWRRDARERRLYERLPAVYRERDAEQGFPLRALLAVIAEQAGRPRGRRRAALGRLLRRDVPSRWVVPYIGELVGNDLLYDASRVPRAATAEELFDDLTGTDLRPPVAVRSRADVAKTISYRRRKGTLPMLEELARDVTGWPAHVVEFFQLLGWTQNVEPSACGEAAGPTSARRSATGRIDGPFDETAHTVDVRPTSTLEGWHGLDTVGFFLWRLRAYPLERVPAREDDRALALPRRARSGTRRRSSRAGAGRATRPASRPSCTFRGRSGTRPSMGTSRATGSSTARWTTRRRACTSVHNGDAGAALADRLPPPRPLAVRPAFRQGDRRRRRQRAGSRSAPASERPRASTPLTTTASRPTSAAGRTTGAAGSSPRPTRRSASRSQRARPTTPTRESSGASRPRSPTGRRRRSAAPTRS